MNDPHVVALMYRIEHNPSINYAAAPPMAHEEAKFGISIEGMKVTFHLKEHFATWESARESIEPYIHAWELTAALNGRPGHFNLIFLTPKIIDRNPTPGTLAVSAFLPPVTGSVNLSVITNATSYPSPPVDVPLDPYDPDVQTMYGRYVRFSEGKEPLPGLAYFCYTMVTYKFPGNANQRLQSAALTLNISSSVLKTVNRLAATKGGSSASRKAEGVVSELSPEEISYLEAAVKIMIRRVAEVAFSGMAPAHQITQVDLPILSP